MPENVQCTLICQDGFEPLNGVTQCRSRGVFLTEWTHLSSGTSSAECFASKESCQSMILATAVKRGRVVNLKNTQTETSVDSVELETTGDDSMYFGTFTSHVDIPVAELASLPSGAVSAWVSLDTKPVPLDSATDQTLFAFTGPDHQPTVFITKGNLLTLDKADTKSYALNWEAHEWHHVMVTWEFDPQPRGTRAFVFIDQVLVKEMVWIASDLSQSLWIGNGKNSEKYSPLKGYMKDVRLWKNVVFDTTLAVSPFDVICSDSTPASTAARVAAAKALVLAQSEQDVQAMADKASLSEFVNLKQNMKQL